MVGKEVLPSAIVPSLPLPPHPQWPPPYLWWLTALKVKRFRKVQSGLFVPISWLHQARHRFQDGHRRKENVERHRSEGFLNQVRIEVHHHWSLPIVQKPVAWRCPSRRKARGYSLAVWGVRELVCWRASQPRPQLEHGILSPTLGFLLTLFFLPCWEDQMGYCIWKNFIILLNWET